MKFRVLLADDHAILRKALRMVLEMTPDIEVVGEAADGHDVIKAVGESHPDVVCMDLNMPGLNGVEATRQLLVTHPNVKVIGLSCHDEANRVAEIIDAGAIGYVVKMEAMDVLPAAIRRVSHNQTYFSPDLNIQDVAAMAKAASQSAALPK